MRPLAVVRDRLAGLVVRRGSIDLMEDGWCIYAKSYSFNLASSVATLACASFKPCGPALLHMVEVNAQPMEERCSLL